MATQIKKKYIENDAIDGLKILLQSDQTLRKLLEDGSTQDVIAHLEQLISDEETRALAAESGLDTKITQVSDDLQDAISQLQAEIAQESSDRSDADSNLQSQITQEISDRQAADTQLQSNIDSEASARENADIELQENIDVEKARIDAILDSSQADKDSFAEIVQLINSVDTENDQAFAGYVLSNDAAVAELESRVDVLESTEEIIEIETLGDAPTLGLEGKLYVTKDENKLYRWAMVGGGELTFDKVVGSGEQYATLQDALSAAVDGENILVKAGSYPVSSTINVDKQVKIVGEDKDLVIFETAASTSAPVSVFNVSVNNVALANMTIKHKKTSNTSVETAVVASGGGFPQTRIQNFIMENCVIEYAEFGLTVRAESWCVRNTTFTYATGSGSNSNRAIGIYGTKGNSFIKDVFLKNDVLNGTSFRPLYLTSTTGSNPNETVSGKLVIEGTTHVGLLSQFFNQDNQQSEGPGSFELQIKNNTINETNLFAGFGSYVENVGDMFSSITLSGNSISNLHAADGGKGLYGVYGSAQFRSSPLVVHAENNTLGQEVYRTGWMAVEGSTVGKETAVPAFTVSLDSSIPESGEAPTIIPQASGGYVEVSAQPDLSGIESDITANSSAISQEILDRQSGDSALDARITTLEGQVGEDLQAVISALQAADSAEQSAREAADLVLDGKIETEKARIDAILLASDADKDSFAEIVQLINSVDTENDQAFAGYVFSNDAALAQEVSDRQAADTNIQSQITSLQGAGDVLFEDDASVYADAKAAIEDPTGRDGWYYKSAGSPDKVNWYFHDGQTNPVTVGEFNRLYTVATVDSSSNDTFHLAYYTFPLGDGQDAGSWYRSRIVYVPSGNFARGVKTLFYMGQEPDSSVYPDLPRVQMTVTTVAGSSVGLNEDTEVILTSVFGTNSGASAGNVELLVNKLGFNSSVYNKEYALEIRGEFTLAGVKQSLLEEAIARESADSALDARIQLLEAVSFEKENFVLTSTDITNGYIDLSNEAIGKSVRFYVGRLAGFEGEDYQLSVVDNVTRVTFIGSFAAGGVEAMEEGDKIKISYSH